MKRLLILALVAACAPAATQPSAAPGGVRNIIFMVADGTGVGLWSAAKFASDALAVEEMPIAGLVDTRSGRHRVTDSAAGATVYATGERTTNRTISVGPASACPLPRGSDTTTAAWPAGCEPLESWFRIARDRGKATGLVTTTAVVDATPAAFAANSPSRYWGDTIAAQLAGFGLDVLMGGGRRHFTASGRNDRRELLQPLCARSTCLSSAADLATYRADDRPLIGLLAEGDFDASSPRPAALPAMVSAALARLERDPDGFVALFETEATDNATHDNAPLERGTADILEFDSAVRVALDFARRKPGTLLIVTSDHETGGFSLPERGEDFELKYTTGGHTGAMVPLFAFGPGAERFGGVKENYEIGRMLLEIARRW